MDIKIVGISFTNVDPHDILTEHMTHYTTMDTYDLTLTLQPEPTNPFDENAIKVLAYTHDHTSVHLGYLPKEVSAKLKLSSEKHCLGKMIDYSNGKMKNVSYSINPYVFID